MDGNAYNLKLRRALKVLYFLITIPFVILLLGVLAEGLEVSHGADPSGWIQREPDYFLIVLYCLVGIVLYVILTDIIRRVISYINNGLFKGFLDYPRLLFLKLRYIVGFVLVCIALRLGSYLTKEYYQQIEEKKILEELRVQNNYNKITNKLGLPKGSIIELDEDATHKPFFHFTASTGDRIKYPSSDGYYRSETHYVDAYIKPDNSGGLEKVELLSMDAEGFEQEKCDRMFQLGATLDDYRYFDSRCIDNDLLLKYGIDATMYTDKRFQNKIGTGLKLFKKDNDLEYDELRILGNNYPYYRIGYNVEDSWLFYVEGDNLIQISDNNGKLSCLNVEKYNLPLYIYDPANTFRPCY